LDLHFTLRNVIMYLHDDDEEAPNNIRRIADVPLSLICINSCYFSPLFSFDTYLRKEFYCLQCHLYEPLNWLARCGPDEVFA
jgi:hypothetical protein